MLTIEKIREAQKTLEEAIYKTDLICAEKLSIEWDLRLKLENLQRTGSFKLRGAYQKIAHLKAEERKRGVIACSAGNHAQGVAYAATRHGIKSLICLPAGAPLSKIEATKNYGAEVCLVPGVYDDAYQRALQLRDEFGYTFIHPFDDEEVIAGQGTIGAEIIDEWPEAEVIVVPIGGGGLISGVAFAAKALKPSVKVYGVQAVGAASMYESLRSGAIGTLSSVSTIADGIAVKQPGVNTFEYCKNYVDGVVTVTDEEIASAMLTLMERQKIVAEGAGAVPIAALLSGKLPEIRGKKVCCLISGGNVDAAVMMRVIRRGLYLSGRQCKLTLDVSDKPGAFIAATQILSKCGANILGIRTDNDYRGEIVRCYVNIELETVSFDHIREIRKELTETGYKIVN